LYEIGQDNCAPDFSGCLSVSSQAGDTCTKLFDDGINAVEGCTVAGWWRPYTMSVTTESLAGSFHYLRLYRKIEGVNSWPQFLVLYQDGNMRLKPHPPECPSDTCFGSSVIIGPAAPSSRPFADIQEARFDSARLALDLTYRNGGTAHISLSVDRLQAVALVDANYITNASVPFTIFRSMYVSDGNADMDHIQSPSGDFAIQQGWNYLQGPWWFFHRATWSRHNTSSPDIRIEASPENVS
jgi:hypothetical protein